MNSQTISLFIDAPASRVYAFAANPENLPRWVPSFCQSVAQIDGKWIVQSPLGAVQFSFAPSNTLGVLDHTITLPSGEQLTNPMRVIANGAGSEIMFTLFQRDGMTDQQYAADAALVRSDLETLRRLCETSEAAADADEAELQTLKQEVLRRIGRNILLFQRVEALLKHLVAHSDILASPGEVRVELERRKGAVENNTLGTIIGKFFETVLNTSRPMPSAEQLEQKFHFRFTLDFNDPDFIEARKAYLKTVVDSRNELVHCMLKRTDADTLAAWAETAHFLDRQRGQAISEITHLKEILVSLQATRDGAIRDPLAKLPPPPLH